MKRAMKYIGWGLAFLAPILLLVVIALVRDHNQPSTASTPPTPATTTAQPTTAALPSPSLTRDEASDSPQVAELRKAVYGFEEAYNAPLSPQRTARLRTLCTDAGFATLVTETEGSSMADEASRDLVVAIDRKANNTIRPEPFGLDDTAVSVFSRIWVTTSRGGTEVNRFRVDHLTSWVMVGSSWKLAYFEQSQSTGGG